MARPQDVRIHKHPTIFVQQLDHVGFYTIVHDDDERYNYEYNHRHDNDSTLYFQTKIDKQIANFFSFLCLRYHDDSMEFY